MTDARWMMGPRWRGDWGARRWLSPIRERSTREAGERRRRGVANSGGGEAACGTARLDPWLDLGGRRRTAGDGRHASNAKNRKWMWGEETSDGLGCLCGGHVMATGGRHGDVAGCKEHSAGGMEAWMPWRHGW